MRIRKKQKQYKKKHKTKEGMIPMQTCRIKQCLLSVYTTSSLVYTNMLGTQPLLFILTNDTCQWLSLCGNHHRFAYIGHRDYRSREALVNHRRLVRSEVISNFTMDTVSWDVLRRVHFALAPDQIQARGSYKAAKARLDSDTSDLSHREQYILFRYSKNARTNYTSKEQGDVQIS